MSYYIRSYEGQDEWVSKKWLAHMNLGNDIYMSFFGATKKEAEEKARHWYEKEQTYFKRIYKPDVPPVAPIKVMNDDGWGNGAVAWGAVDASEVKPVDNSWGEPTTGRGHHFAGKVWMVGMKDGVKHKTRVDQSEVAAYEANGYKKGGPRS
jgi:hypothetical protein